MKRMQKLAVAGALAGVSVLGGAIGASVLGTAGAATSSTSTPAAPSSQASIPAHGSAQHEDAEKAVTSDAATKAQAAAVKSVGSGTAGAVTTDFTGSGYEVTVTKSDGTQVEGHVDSSFSVMDGHGGPGGGPGDNASATPGA